MRISRENFFPRLLDFSIIGAVLLFPFLTQAQVNTNEQNFQTLVNKGYHSFIYKEGDFVVRIIEDLRKARENGYGTIDAEVLRVTSTKDSEGKIIEGETRVESAYGYETSSSAAKHPEGGRKGRFAIPSKEGTAGSPGGSGGYGIYWQFNSSDDNTLHGVPGETFNNSVPAGLYDRAMRAKFKKIFEEPLKPTEEVGSAQDGGNDAITVSIEKNTEQIFSGWKDFDINVNSGFGLIRNFRVEIFGVRFNALFLPPGFTAEPTSLSTIITASFVAPDIYTIKTNVSADTPTPEVYIKVSGILEDGQPAMKNIKRIITLSSEKSPQVIAKPMPHPYAGPVEEEPPVRPVPGELPPIKFPPGGFTVSGSPNFAPYNPTILDKVGIIIDNTIQGVRNWLGL